MRSELVNEMKHTVLLMGTPNVGKSVIFNYLTGLNVRVANYTGTTVDYARGMVNLNGRIIDLIDVPGTYSLCATCEAEEVAVEMVCGRRSVDCNYASSSCCAPPSPAKKIFSQGKENLAEQSSVTAGSEENKPSLIVYVLDAGNFEGGLYLLLQLLELDVPLVVALNRGDLARKKGYLIDINALASALQVPVIPTIAVTGEGLKELETEITEALNNQAPNKYRANSNLKATWDNVENLSGQVLRRTDSTGNTRKETWDQRLTSPWPGLPLAILILAVVFAGVVGIGMGLRQFILLPLFRDLIIPPIINLVSMLIPAGVIQNIFIGEYGFLVKGLEWPFTLVLPYVLSFYAMLSLLEDSGYLPRLAILLDGLLNRIGLPGSGVIPLMLGYGCGIPAIMATRALGSHKQKVIVTILVCLAIPCISQTGAFISLLAARSALVMIAIFLFGLLVMIVAGLILNRYLKGAPPDLITEIPDLLLPRFGVALKKLWLRLKLYITDGALPMIGAVGLAAVLYESGLMALWGRALSPLVTGWLQLPEAAAVPLALGILRRELTVLPLLDMELTTIQLFTGAVVGLFYVPCIAIVATVAREFKLSTALYILFLTTFLAFLTGGLVSRLGSLVF